MQVMDQISGLHAALKAWKKSEWYNLRVRIYIYIYI